MASVDSQLKVLVAGLPGTGKSTSGLSFHKAGEIEHHVWGVGEEETHGNFPGAPIKTVKLLWRDCLSDAEKDQIADDKTLESVIDQLEEKAKYLNILRYKKYIYRVNREIETGKRPDLKTVFVDNLTPLADEFKSYIMAKYRADIYTAQGNFDGRKFWPKYADELESLIRNIITLPVNVVISSHIALSLEQENAAKAMDKTAPTLNREWLPQIDGKLRFGIGGLFSFCFYFWCEESPGRDNKYFAKAEADDKSVGLAKCRIQPFPNPRRIDITKNEFYQQLTNAISTKTAKAPQPAPQQGGNKQ